MTVSSRLFLAAGALAVALPSAASAQTACGCSAPPAIGYGYADASCAAPIGGGFGPTCAAPVYATPACGDICGPTCAAPAYYGGCDYGYACPPQQCCVKGFFSKLWELEKRKNAWLLSKLRGNGCGCVPDCAPVCAPVCAPPVCAAPTFVDASCAAPVYAAPACAAPVVAAPVVAAPAGCGCH
ncbi:MAG: hypothetical protein AAF907_03420 [Planctomycetota bacterium]